MEMNLNYIKGESIEKINLEKISIDINAVQIISKDRAIKECLIPFKIKEEELYVAIKKDYKLSSIEYLKFISCKKIRCFIAEEEQIKKAINKYYDKNDAQIALKNIKKEYQYYDLKEDKEKEIKYVQSSPTVKFTNYIIKEAICKRASDIHIEPFEEHVRIRFRIDGILYEMFRIELELYSLICTRIKIMANMNITEKRIPQDGKINFTLNKNEYDFRVSSIPVVYGEKIVIRILDKVQKNVLLDKLGFDKENMAYVKQLLKASQGIILITGPTGSGKSTTLYSMINEINKGHKNIITIEDPVEYTIQGINQININNKIGLTFAKGLKSILRQDPDVIMIGEIRDEETAQIAIRAAITGHLVFSTLHTNDSISALVRLTDMGIPSYLVSDAVIGVIAQRLVRKICPYCKKEYTPSKRQRSLLKLNLNDKLYMGEGCSKCGNTGYSGRTIVYEFMRLDEFYKKIMEKQNFISYLRDYNKKTNKVSLKDTCSTLVKKGITTFEELIRIIY